ncbi:MAG: tetratricopeptide repeat protein [Methanospirillaceae archaeon]|nr:tetratricopeptide repeat protein [Methanospirillaceae archaeon]
MHSTRFLFSAILIVILFFSLLAGCINQESWTAQQWYDEAALRAAAGSYQQALDAYNRSIGLDPANAAAYTQRGIAFQNLGLTSEALRDFDQAIALHPDETAAWQGKSLIYIEQEKYSLARIAAQQVIRIGTGPVQNAWYLKGIADAKNGDLEEGLRSLNEAIQIEPAREDFWKYKAFILNQLGRNSEVLLCYEKLTEINPGNPEYWNMKGQMHVNLGEINQATEAFSMAKKLVETA